MKYDIIGDIHGHAGELEALLEKLGYRRNRQGVYAHAEANRQAIFVGDFIDRGPGQFRVLNIVRAMVDAGYAQAIMGNHEFNAGMYHTHVLKDGEMTPLRPHNEQNGHQHRAFLDAFNADPRQGRNHINWFKALPMYLELDGFKVVHALWDDEAINLLKHQGVLDEKNRIKPDQWEILADYKAPRGKAAELLTKGLEVDLPDGVSFRDQDGIERWKARLKWWVDLNDQALTFDKIVLDVPKGAIDPIPVPESTKAIIRKAQAQKEMVFFGHYWQKGPVPVIESPRAVCLDRSIAKKGHLAAATITVKDGMIQDMGFTSVESMAHIEPEQTHALRR